MPCYDSRDSSTNIAEERIKHLKTDMDKIRTKINLLTRLLCESGKIMAYNGVSKDEMSEELKDWLWEHDKDDRKRNAK